MQFLTTTPLALLLFGAILLLGPVRGLWCFFLSMPLGSAAALGLTGLGTLSMPDFCIVALWVSLLFHRVGLANLAGTLRPGQPGFLLLLVLVISAIGAIFMPRVMTGSTDVFFVASQAGSDTLALSPLAPSGANLTQLARLGLAASAFVVLATVFRLDGSEQQVQRAVVVASLVHLVLSIVDLGSYELGLPDLLDPLRTAQFLMLDNQQIFGVKRLVGGFPEPSSFSFYTIGLYGYWLRLWFGAKRSRLAGAMLLITSVLLLRSTSTSAYATMGTFTALFVVWHFGAALREKKPMTALVVLGATLPLVLGVLLAAYGLLPNLRAMIDGMFVTKIASDSGVERLEWNLQALRNFRDTYGFGAGLGSVRASSWLVSCLGSLGVIGTGVFVWFIAAVTAARPDGAHRATAKVETAAALQAGCLAILLQSLITKPYPNLEAPFFAMAGIAVGLLRHVQTTQSATSRSPFFGRNRIKPI